MGREGEARFKQLAGTTLGGASEGGQWGMVPPPTGEPGRPPPAGRGSEGGPAPWDPDCEVGRSRPWVSAGPQG